MQLVLKCDTKAKITKQKTDKLDLIKIKTCVLQNTPIMKWKDNTQTGKKIHSHHLSDKGFVTK